MSEEKAVEAVKEAVILKDAVIVKAVKKGKFRRFVWQPVMTAIGIFFFPVTWFFTRKKAIDEVTCHSADAGFFLWLPIVAGFSFSGLVRLVPDWSGVFGWVYVWIIVFIVLTLIYDINARMFALLTVVFAAIWFGLRHIEHLQNIVILGAITKHLADLDPQFDPGFGSVVAWIMLAPFCYALYHLFAYGRKKFTPNEICEYHFMDGNEMSDRQGMRFRTKYRDLLETILTFGGGDIIALDNMHQEIKRYPNILFLYFIWPRLERVLNQRAVVEEN